MFQAMANGKFVAYFRVSTARQGRSGLGLEAQRKTVVDYLNGGRWKLVGEFTEVETGKQDDRPELAKALRLAKVMGATLIVAKLDRLSRNAAFLLTLRDSGVRFVAADMPEANTLTVGILAVVAQAEREAISARTIAALAAAKDRGVKLGRPDSDIARYAAAGNAAGVAKVKAKADQRARDLADVLADIEAAGITSNNAIAAELNRREIPTARGKRWHDASVARMRARLAG
jgi:DNA invertase Pin-like site-specific DNA recombinase